MTSNVQLLHPNTSREEVEFGAVHAYMHIVDMFNRSNPDEFAKALAIMDKDLADEFSRSGIDDEIRIL